MTNGSQIMSSTEVGSFIPAMAAPALVLPTWPMHGHDREFHTVTARATADAQRHNATATTGPRPHVLMPRRRPTYFPLQYSRVSGSAA